jgi:hypothetical protein
MDSGKPIREYFPNTNQEEVCNDQNVQHKKICCSDVGDIIIGFSTGFYSRVGTGGMGIFAPRKDAAHSRIVCHLPVEGL